MFIETPLPGSFMHRRRIGLQRLAPQAARTTGGNECMPDFTYEALAGTGQRIHGTMTANSEREVVSFLDGKGLWPLHIEMAKGAARGQRGGRRIGSR